MNRYHVYAYRCSQRRYRTRQRDSIPPYSTVTYRGFVDSRYSTQAINGIIYHICRIIKPLNNNYAPAPSPRAPGFRCRRRRRYPIHNFAGKWGLPRVIGPWTKCRLTRVSSGPLSVCKPAHDGRRKSGQLSSRPNDIINFKPIMLFKYLKCKLYFYGPRVGQISYGISQGPLFLYIKLRSPCTLSYRLL